MPDDDDQGRRIRGLHGDTDPIAVIRDDSEDLTPPPQDLDELTRRLWPFRKLHNIVLALQQSIIDIAGTSGRNGKLGALRDRVDRTETRRWQVICAAVGAALTVLVGSFAVTRYVVLLEGRIESLEQRLDRREYRVPAVPMPLLFAPPRGAADAAGENHDL